MRILWVNHRDPRHPQAGGAEEYIYQVSKRWSAWGHSVTIYSERPPGAPHAEILDGIKILRRGSFYTHHIWAPLYLLRNRSSYDVVLDNVAHVIPFYSSIVKRETVAVVHHVNGDVLDKILTFPLNKLAKIIERTLPYAYSKYVVPSNATKRTLWELGASKKEIYVVNPGVDHNVYKPGKKSSKPLILWLNRFVKYKNPDHAVKAFSLIKKVVNDAVLIMAGDGPMRKEVEILASKMGLRDVIFTGKIDLATKVKYLQEAWVCVYTSDIEGWGLVALEAAACGTPCVGYAVGGLVESIRHGETGLLAKHNDINDLADKILLLLERETAERMGNNAIRFSQQFSWEKTALKLYEVISRAA